MKKSSTAVAQSKRDFNQRLTIGLDLGDRLSLALGILRTVWGAARKSPDFVNTGVTLSQVSVVTTLVIFLYTRHLRQTGVLR